MVDQISTAAEADNFEILAEKSALLPAVQAAAKAAVLTANTIPILGNLRLHARDGTLRVTGTDVELTVTSRAAVEVVTEGATTVPARALVHLATSAAEGAQIRMRLDGSRLAFAAGPLKARLPTLPSYDFPNQKGASDGAVVTVPASSLARVFDRLAAAISREEVRYYLCGVCFEQVAEGLRLVATDGHRLHALSLDCRIDGDVPRIVLPERTVSLLRRIDAGDVRLSISETGVTVETDKLEVLSKVIDGTFPDWERAVPRSAGAPTPIPVTELAAVAKRLLYFQEKGSALTLRRRPGSLAVGIASPLLGGAAEAIDCDGDGNWEVGTQGHYLAAALEAMAVDRADLHFFDPLSPLRFDVDGGIDNGGATFVVMPFRGETFPEDILNQEAAP